MALKQVQHIKRNLHLTVIIFCLKSWYHTSKCRISKAFSLCHTFQPSIHSTFSGSFFFFIFNIFMPQKTMIRTCYFFKARNENWVSFNLMLPERGFLAIFIIQSASDESNQYRFIGQSSLDTHLTVGSP